MSDNKDDKPVDNQLMIAPKGKGFTIFRGDTARLDNGKIKGTLYDINKSLRPSIGRSWTTSYKKAKEFACQYAEYTKDPIVPIIYHGVPTNWKRIFLGFGEGGAHIKR